MARKYDGRWETLESLSEGGQAHAFRVRDMGDSNGAEYVLKRLKNPQRIDRFKREIESVRKLDHENIVKIVDHNLSCEQPYFVMEYCKGGSLESAIPFWEQSPEFAFDLFEQICCGVSAAHQKGIVHRDLKPANVFLRYENGPAVVGDFGLCFVEGGDLRLTNTHEAVGPRLFMAPEMEDGISDEVSDRADIYSLGKILYWLLSESQTFSRENHRKEIYDLRNIRKDKYTSRIQFHYEHVNRMLDKMISINIDERPTIRDVLKMLRETKRLLFGEYSPVDPDIPQPCQYCGIGFYKIVAAGDGNEVSNFGINLVGAPDWRVMVCGECGHVQLFRPDLARRDGPWSRK